MTIERSSFWPLNFLNDKRTTFLEFKSHVKYLILQESFPYKLYQAILLTFRIKTLQNRYPRICFPISILQMKELIIGKESAHRLSIEACELLCLRFLLHNQVPLLLFLFPIEISLNFRNLLCIVLKLLLVPSKARDLSY